MTTFAAKYFLSVKNTCSTAAKLYSTVSTPHHNVCSRFNILHCPKQYTSRSTFVDCCSFINSRSICTSNVLMKKARVTISFTKPDGSVLTGQGKEGESLLDVVVNNSLDLKGYGACEGTLSCSTCHVVLKPEDFEKLEEKATDEELDMLELAIDVDTTSRLGCQVNITKRMDGLIVNVPDVIRDARESAIGSDTAPA